MSDIGLQNGHYKAMGNLYRSIHVQDEKVVSTDSCGIEEKVKVESGDFGPADDQMSRVSGQAIFSVKFCYTWHGMEFVEHGVLCEDGRMVIMKGPVGICKLEWLTDEEFEEFEAEGDPMEEPPGPYTRQPETAGKMLWITGAPGLGKSTVAQMLGRDHGFVWYEGDCFGNCTNPYIPLEAESPSLAQWNQKVLRGEGLEQRREVVRHGIEAFTQYFSGEHCNQDQFEEYFSGLCEDLLRERNRIGGNWAVSAVTLTRQLRNLIRSKLGADLVFVVLVMGKDEVRRRMMERHGDEDTVRQLMEVHKLCEDGAVEEENTFNIEISADMSKDEVLRTILKTVE